MGVSTSSILRMGVKVTSYVDLAGKIFSFTDSDDVNVRSFGIVTQVHEAVSSLSPICFLSVFRLGHVYCSVFQFVDSFLL